MKVSLVTVSKTLLFIAILFCAEKTCSQDRDSIKEVSLPAVIIKAFEQNRRLKDVPAAINYIGRQTLKNFSTSSIVAAVNTTPGVRMEERSPGSYRINIRGSSLRSPFGVRNVKIYYNDIPFTDPGGNSYLNQLGYYNFNSIEIIRGSNNSLYGAGTGGVLLIESLKETETPEVSAEYSAGTYHLQNYYASFTNAPDKIVSRVAFQHQESNGYRDHSRLKKDVISWNSLFMPGKNRLMKITFLYGDLFYETPGALTKAEFNANPKKARPATASFPGAESANASIHQKMFLAGATYAQPITDKLQNKTTLYGMFTELRNPNINSYDKSSEPHTGGRTVFKFEQPFKNMALHIDAGGEFQKGFTSVNIYKNVGGNADTLRSTDDINNRQSVVFLQTSLYVKDWTVVASASRNTFRVRFQRFQPASSGEQERTFNTEVVPRFALMKKCKLVNIYTSVARGFSPPTTAELLPTGGAINLGLDAEKGINYDMGAKGNLWGNTYIDVNIFLFTLKNTIVQRRDAGGGNFFVNAGKTRQYGVETFISYPLPFAGNFKRSLLWISHTWHNFHYRDFKQLANDFTGKRLPSVPLHTISSGIDIAMKNGLSATITYFYSGKIPLNDANSDYAKPYHLAGAKTSFEPGLKKKIKVNISAGVENLLNETFSLGNDINGFGGRYYNAAAQRNFYVSVSFSIQQKANKEP